MLFLVFHATLLVNVLLIKSESHHKYPQYLPSFLDPPPTIPQSIKTLSQSADHFLRSPKYVPGDKNLRNMRNVLKPSSWLWPSKKEDNRNKNDFLRSNTIFNHNAKSESKYDCNRCNSIPWIPIAGYSFEHSVHVHEASKGHSVQNNIPVHDINHGYPLGFNIPIREQSNSYSLGHNIPVHEASNEYPVEYEIDVQTNNFAQSIPRTPHPYYASIREMSNHLIQPTVPQIIKYEVPVPPYETIITKKPNNVQEFNDNYIESHYNPAALDCFDCFSSSGNDNIQAQSGTETSVDNSIKTEHIHQANNFFQSTNKNSPSVEITAKPMSLSHYLLSIDYPVEVIKSPIVDIPQSTWKWQSNPGLESQSTVPHHKNVEEPFIQFNHNNIDHSSNEYEVSPTSGFINDTDDKLSQTGSNVANNLSKYLIPPHFSSNDHWLIALNELGKATKATSTLSPKKQIQIVVPYLVKANNTQVQTKIIPSTESDKKVTRTIVAASAPIANYLRKEPHTKKQNDWNEMMRLQQTIDTWTADGYSNHKHKFSQVRPPSSTLPQSKEIPVDYLETTTFDSLKITTSSSQKKHYIKISTNKTLSNITDIPSRIFSSPQLWNEIPVSVSALTKEKVYIVTPVPFTSFNVTEATQI